MIFDHEFNVNDIAYLNAVDDSGDSFHIPVRIVNSFMQDDENYYMIAGNRDDLIKSSFIECKSFIEVDYPDNWMTTTALADELDRHQILKIIE